MLTDDQKFFQLAISLAAVITLVLCGANGWPLLMLIECGLLVLAGQLLIMACQILPWYIRGKWLKEYFPMSASEIIEALRSDNDMYKEYDAELIARNMSVQLSPEQLAPLIVATPDAFLTNFSICNVCAIARVWESDQIVPYVMRYLKSKYGDAADNCITEDIIRSFRLDGYFKVSNEIIKKEREVLTSFIENEYTLIHPSESDLFERKRFFDLITITKAYQKTRKALATSTKTYLTDSASGIAFIAASRQTLDAMERAAHRDIADGIETITDVANRLKEEGV